ncbi:18498_t:CDS:2, partial [Racocetra persica]
RDPFKTTKEYIFAVIRNQMHYYSMFKSTNKQKSLIPKYEELYQLVPKYFQHDGNDTFVLTHIDFHTSNILVKNDEIIGVIDWECSDAFLVECLYEMSCCDPDFIRTMDNIDEEKKEFIPQCLAKKYGK